ncbi:hypothetical protein [Hyphomicrobium sp. ghe19]|uniref:hypothetical protein n=1 Tax=Hyphomicrobium sp. ghe19 TaxID=2682968 RepID=UPI001366E3F5|nr:hypothetical protein HYPP_02509 [Hyphomicrobium sp. ghe19]
MSKQQISATELVNTEVNFVSLVKRGANRIPFRITKEDQNMIDLHKIGRAIFKMAEPKIDVVGVILQKGADLDKVNAVLKAAGLDADALVKSEKDGVVTLAKADAPTGSVLKVSDEVALVVTADLQKSFSGVDFTSWSFGEVLATEGYFTGVCTSVDVLKSTVANILHEATSSSEAAAAVGKAVDEMKNYLISLTGGLPVQAFKADVEFSRAGSLAKAEEAPAAESAQKADEAVAETVVEKAEEAKTEPTAKEEVSANPVHGSTTTDTKLGTKSPDNNIDEDPVEGNATPPASGGKSNVGEKSPSNDVEGNPAVTKSADTDKDQELDDSKSGAGAKDRGPEAPAVKADNAVVLEAIEALRKSVEDEIAGMKKSVTEISDRVETVSVLAKKTDAALNGTVFNDAGGDTVRTQKSETHVPLLDTAYSRRTA